MTMSLTTKVVNDELFAPRSALTTKFVIDELLFVNDELCSCWLLLVLAVAAVAAGVGLFVFGFSLRLAPQLLAAPCGALEPQTSVVKRLAEDVARCWDCSLEQVHHTTRTRAHTCTHN